MSLTEEEKESIERGMARYVQSCLNRREIMSLTEEEKQILDQAIARYNGPFQSEIPKQRGRCKGWMLIYDRFIREKTDACRAYITSHGLRFLHWSSLSGDPDDENDFAIGKDRYW